jgi:hypothetical protein
MDKGEDALFARSWQVRANATDGAGGAATSSAGIFSLHARAHIRTHDFTHTHTHRQKQRKKGKYVIIILYLSGFFADFPQRKERGKISRKKRVRFPALPFFSAFFPSRREQKFTAASPSS